MASLVPNELYLQIQIENDSSYDCAVSIWTTFIEPSHCLLRVILLIQDQNISTTLSLSNCFTFTSDYFYETEL